MFSGLAVFQADMQFFLADMPLFADYMKIFALALSTSLLCSLTLSPKNGISAQKVAYRLWKTAYPPEKLNRLTQLNYNWDVDTDFTHLLQSWQSAGHCSLTYSEASVVSGLHQERGHPGLAPQYGWVSTHRSAR